MDSYRPDTRTAHERAVDDALDHAYGRPQSEDDLILQRVCHGVAIFILAISYVYIGVRFFDFDTMHEPPPVEVIR